MYCPKCGIENNDSNKFCSFCGADLSATVQKPKTKKSKLPVIIFVCIAVIAIVVSSIVINQVFVKSSYETKPWEYVSGNDCGLLIAVKNDGTVIWEDPVYGDDTSTYVKYDLSDWQDIKSVASSHYYVAGLKNDGTVTVKTAYNVYNVKSFDKDNKVDITNDWIKNETYIKIKEDVKVWNNIVSICAGEECLVGLKADGSVVIAGDNENKLDASKLTDIIQISIGTAFAEEDFSYDYIVAIKGNGTVETVIPYMDEKNESKEAISLYSQLYDFSDWNKVSYVYEGYWYPPIGLKKTGEVLITQDNTFLELEQFLLENASYYDEYEIDHIYSSKKDLYERIKQLDDIVQIITTEYDYIYALKSDGTVVVDSSDFSLYYKYKNEDISKIYNETNKYLEADDIEEFEEDWFEYCEEVEEELVSVSKIENAIAIIDCDGSLVVLRSDGTLCHIHDYVTEFDSWTDIKTSETSSGKSKNNTILSNTENTSSQVNESAEKATIINYTTTATDSKETTVTDRSKQSFYEDKYYLFADERGELNVYVFQLYDDNVKVTVYDNTEGYSTPTYTERYPLKWNDEYTYAENDLGMEYVIDYDWMVVQHKDSDMAKLQALREYSDLSKSDLEKFASEYL